MDNHIPMRYPNGLPGGIPSFYYDDRDEAEKALAWSEKIMTQLFHVIASPSPPVGSG
jgi:hypothetical protein